MEVRHGDLCREGVDAIVNAANERMMHGAGVARAIADAAGGGIVDRESAEWIRSNGLLVTGRVAAITSAGALPCKWVVHVTGPTQERDAPLLRSAVMAALNKAEEANCESIALPAISSGIFGFPLPLCAKILVECGMEFARGGPRFVRRIAYTNIDIKTATALQKALEDYRPDEPGAAGAAGAGVAGSPVVRSVSGLEQQTMRKDPKTGPASAFAWDPNSLPPQAQSLQTKGRYGGRAGGTIRT